MRGAALGSLLCLAFAQDAAKVTVTVDERDERGWHVTGTADFPERTRLHIMAQRVSRAFDASDSLFREYVSTDSMAMTVAEVTKKSYRAVLIPAAPGSWRVEVYDSDAVVGSAQLLLGRFDEGIRRAKGHVEALRAAIDEASAIFKVLRRTKGAAMNQKMRDETVKRIAAARAKLDAASRGSDLSATFGGLLSVFALLENAEVWKGGDGASGAAGIQYEGVPASTPPSEDTPEEGWKDPDFEEARRVLNELKGMLSLEGRISVADMFAVVLSRADGTPEALAAVRALAKDALEAVRAAPERDTSFEDLLAPLIDPKSKPDLAEIRRLLVEFTKPLVKRMS